VEKTGIEALLPFVEKATPKRPPTPAKTLQDWDKSLYRQNVSISSNYTSSQSTFVPDFSSSQLIVQDNLSDIKTELQTIKLILKELSINQGEVHKKVQNVITRVSRVEQKQFETDKLKEKENMNQKTIPNAFLDNEPWNFPKNTSKIKQCPSFEIDLTNRFSALGTASNVKENGQNCLDNSAERNASRTGSSKQPPVKKRPLICCTENHLNNYKPIRPGSASYSQAVKDGGRVQVHSDSMMQRIRKAEFYRNLKRGFGSIRCYPGARPNHMKHYIMPHVLEDAPEVFVAHSGTNSIHDRDITDEELARDVVSIGTNAKNLGAQKIIISGIIVRRNGMHVERRRRNVNRIIEDLCMREGFVFVNNDNIRLEDIDEKDRVHLLESGSIKLANNVLDAINNTL